MTCIGSFQDCRENAICVIKKIKNRRIIYKAKHQLKWFLLLVRVPFSQSIKYLIGKQTFLTQDGQVHGQARTTCDAITNYMVGYYMWLERILMSPWFLQSCMSGTKINLANQLHSIRFQFLSLINKDIPFEDVALLECIQCIRIILQFLQLNLSTYSIHYSITW